MPQEATGLLRVAFYARVSTEEQREGQTIDSQVKELERFAEANHWAPVGVYKDEGWSGTRLARPELDRLRDDALKKPFDVVLINDVDRLARDVTHLNVIRRDLERKGVQVVFRKLPGDLSPTQNLMINILGSFAEFEREMILDRTRRGVRYKVEVRKLYLGCRPAYGYRYTTKAESPEAAGRLEPCPEEAAVVRKIYNWVDEESLSARQVVTRLNQLHIPARKQGHWGKSSVLRVLRNEMYAGVWYYNKHYSCEPINGSAQVHYSKILKSSRRLRSRAEWTAVPLQGELRLVPRNQWDRVQERLTANISWSPRNSKHNYLLRSLVRCAGCNARMVGEPGRSSFSYRCHKRCKKVPEIVEERLNRTVWNALSGAIKNPQVILHQGQKYYEEREKLQAGNDLERQQAVAALAQLEREEQRILEAYRQGLIESEQLGRELTMLKDRRNAVQMGVRKSEPSTDSTLPESLEERVREYCRRVSHVMANLSLTQRQDLLRILVREVVFDGKRVIIKARIPCDNAPELNPYPFDAGPVSRLSNDHHPGGIETTTRRTYGRNLAGFHFELVEMVKQDLEKVNTVRKANLVKANAPRRTTLRAALNPHWSSSPHEVSERSACADARTQESALRGMSQPPEAG